MRSLHIIEPLIKPINIFVNFGNHLKPYDMKNISLLTVLLLLAIISFSQKITRGPDIGEIYFLGPTHTGTGLYYSTDFGETTVCVDSLNFITSIAADKTPGGVYSVTMPVNLYYSDNYGYPNSWVFRTGELDDNIKSGVTEGYIFSGCVLHSEDYGENFSYHSLNGFFGNPKNNAIDNVDDNIGYVITNKLTVADTLYLLRSYDKFENLELVQKLHFPNGEITYLSRGYNSGELFLYYKLSNILNFSNDFAENFDVIDNFNFHNYYSFGVIGGRQTGEVYILYNFVNLMWQNAHIYICHSTDYGITFEVFHPFAKGNEPLLANFSTITQEGNQPLEVEFCNYSIGDIMEYQWDFDNDGEIDSYEQSPTYIYPDTGFYSVKLTIVGNDSSNSFLRENYIHVKKLVGINENISANEIKCYPNPFSLQITIEITTSIEIAEFVILNNSGKQVRSFLLNNDKYLIWDGTDNKGDKCKPGIYFVKGKNKQQFQKILLTY